MYILASRRNGTLYTGVTSNLRQRIYQHQRHLIPGFTDDYDVTMLVWYQECPDIESAISIEKKVKNRNRKWKLALIERENPNWDDLSSPWEA
ncbi:MAG: GIY-YIG nuclease family protein [Promicromonosporaceae bacterium]|nr:GIY-YIG nuclease family protein [Promicromonosporaceae bacterium]